ncbi:single-stranded DNA-binding protein [Methylovulum psychrotolerans]|uniref:Single-stranded DNA-binding protein n=1 Tax=Methylovulum psychrotolerans TaxID=1704499 RepID=A0A2S5CII8_9GAMM|nr:single-stranded DNA-binding protein [Methylovulum psychrotolerans]POZ50628.1 single-stranded DNA-binding protein [Methylovulum psychrotolerans]
MHNSVTLVGRLGKEPEIRYTQEQAPIATLSIATTEYRKDGAASHTEWHRVVLFGKLAEIVRDRNPKKGSMILIEGSLRTRKWQDSAKVDRYTTEIIANIYTELGSKSEHSSNASDNPF